MGVKKTFSISENHEVHYRYTCGHCGGDSGVLTYRFTERVERTKHGTFVAPSLSAEEQEEMRAEVRENLACAVAAVKEETKGGVYQARYFNGKCRHCNKYQTWSGGSFIQYALVYPFWMALGAGMLGFVPMLFVYGANHYNSSVLMGFAGLLAGVYAAFFAVRCYKWFSMRSDGKKQKQNSRLDIDWGGM